MEVIGKLTNAPPPVTSWHGVGSMLFNLDHTNVYTSIKFICEFKLVPDYATTESFKLTLRKSFKFLQQKKVVTP